MDFKKGDRVTYPSSAQVYRVESGPWISAGGTERYLLEVLTGDDAGQHRFYESHSMIPAPPQVGDKGRMAMSLNPLRKVRELNADYAVLELVDPEVADGGHELFVLAKRRYFDSSWRPEA